MKKSIIYFISLIIISLGFSSCNDFLNPDADSDIREDDFYRNDADVNQAVIACYNGLQTPMNNEWALTELRSDNSRLYLSSSTSTASRNINALDIFRVETTNPTNNGYWESTYHNIANCNTVLANLAVVSDSLSRQFEGEALFIRSYHYFNLVRLYGPVFLVTKRLLGDEAKYYSRSSTADVYNLIEDDLKKAIEDLPLKYPDSQKGRVTKTAAKALLAKVYLTLKRFNDAQPLLLEAQADSNYGFANTYGEIFSIDNEMNKEIIFAVRYKSGNKGIGSPFANSFAAANSFDVIVNGGGSGNNFPTFDLIQAYEPNDKRKSVTLSETWLDGKKNVYAQYVTKYLSPVTTLNDAENDWPVLRYTDVLLMLAEVKNELGTDRTGALSLLNQVRSRAGVPTINIEDVSSYTRFKLALEKERRLEFAFENQRYFDLLRTDRLIPVMDIHFQKEIEKDRSSGIISSYYRGSSSDITYLPVTILENWQPLLPIPFAVISVSPNATQNYGY